MRLIRFVEKFFVLFPLLLTFTSSIPDKVCKGDVILDGSNIDSFKDCTTIDGYLIIKNETFTGGKSTPKMDPSELEVFSTVNEITGSLFVTASHPNFTGLHYFRNLEIIGGKWNGSVVRIMGTSLISLGLRSLNRMAYRVIVQGNNNLCFADGINWRKLVDNFDIEAEDNLGEAQNNGNITIDNNRPKDACRADNMVCHEECSEDGCWGPGVDECLSCKRFSLDGTCVDSCFHPGIYQSGELTCGKCHEECDGNCTGPGPGNCVKCKRVKYEQDCVASCPSMTYEMNGDCVQCNETCVGGCDGWDNGIVGYNNPIQVDAQGCYLKTDEPCKEGHFSVLVNVTETTNAWKLMSICCQCHPRCKNCTGYGFHLSVCNECARFRSEEQCEDRCPIEYYADNTTMRCIRCSSDCKGCRGPGSDQCESCRNLKVPLGDNITHEFVCSDTCPEDKPRIEQGQGGLYCLAKVPVEKLCIAAIIVAAVEACILLIACIVAAYRNRCWQRTCLRGNTDGMAMPLQGIPRLESTIH